MPGPAPKDPSLRARRNKTSTAATLRVVEPANAAPARHALPERVDEDGAPVEWHARAVDWWERAWASPMAAEWLDADVPGLELVAELWDEFYKATSPSLRIKLSAELRSQERRFGLAPMDRRTLQWEVERAEDAQDKGRRRRVQAAPPSGSPKTDPRALLGS